MKLNRSIGLVGLTLIATGGILGSGWLFAPELVARDAGPAAILSWVIGAVIMLLLALTFAEVSGMLPVAGGLAQVPLFSHGKLVSTVMAWTAWVGYAVTAPIEVSAMMKYMSAWIPEFERAGDGRLPLMALLAGLGILAVMVFINAWGVHIFTRVNSGLTWIKVLLPAIIVGAFLSERFDLANFTTPSFAPFGYEGILTGVSTGGVIFAFLGFRHAIDLAGEVRSPHRTIPIALISALLFCLVIYIGAQAAFTGALTGTELGGGWQALDFGHDYGPFADLGLSLGLVWLLSLIYASAIIAPFGGGLVSTGSNARLAMAMASNGQFPKLIARISPEGVPLYALLLNWCIGAAALALATFQQMVSLTSAAIVLSLVSGPIAVHALRRQLPDRPRYFRLPAVGLLANLGFIAATLTLYWSGWTSIRLLLFLILAGLVLFLLFRRLSDTRESLDLREALWLLPYLVGLGLLSYFGNFGDGRGLIPFGWDLALAALLSLVIFAYAGQSRLHPAAVLDYLAESEKSVKPAGSKNNEIQQSP
ncbi:amino acid permease [Sneathiella chungangensis]|uniref:Amino acid permease n=1 Tax=Sneathiella chungangensis TaxID=1418234 RepID=A0A845MB62_9PROT|nr:APC family permease [Sneathiella chungangensis]MZR20726.1 amino acid permease [Sneathiella chungangensis]